MRPAHSEVRGAMTPTRQCVGCRERCRAEDLLRVVAVEGACVPDPWRRLPGRGASLHPVGQCLEAALRRRAFTRALRVAGPLDTGALERYVRDRAGGSG